jgi:hypothetical protein
MASVLGRVPEGCHQYIAHVVVRGDDGFDQQVTQKLWVDRVGPNSRIQGDMGEVSRKLGAAMNTLNGGYLFLTAILPSVNRDMYVSWGWQVLAAELMPLGGDEAWHVRHAYPKSHGGLAIRDWMTYEDAWTPK